jgi:two-component system, NtrC family, response regulator GlrR
MRRGGRDEQVEADGDDRPTVDVGGGTAPVVVRRFRVRVVAGPDSGAERMSQGKALAIGTHPSADLVLNDRTVSRFHCSIDIVDGIAQIRDLGSRNGTLVDNVPILHAPLRERAVLALGTTEIHFDLGRESITIEASQREAFGSMVGRSPAMRAVFAQLERAAGSDITVLLEGETGTGKEIAAEALHRESGRAEGPFVVVDCGSIAPELVESELFGHERGAFTGADRARVGAFEAAHGGTLFLDEIGELDSDVQPKLLRAVESRSIRRVGSTSSVPVDVRLVAATWRDLRAEVNAGRFRPDLYYRLAVFPVRIPPLRERMADLSPVVEKLLRDLDADAEATERLRAPAFMARLMRHGWPGNIRELRNHLERSLIISDASPFPGIHPTGDGPITVDPTRSLKVSRDEWIRQFERRYLEALLTLHAGNVRAAAAATGVDRVYLYRLLWKHGLK